MADPRVHPATAAPPTSSSSTATSSESSTQNPRPPNPPPSNPVPPPATYVVQLPREQIFRYPPPENTRKFEARTRRKARRSCCCFTFCLLLLLIVAAAVSAGMLYLVFRFKSPNIRAENPNGKVGIYYLKDSAVDVLYDNLKLSDGVLPAFYQPRKNVTVLKTSLTGTNVALEAAVRRTLRNAQNQRKVPLVVNVKAPVKIKVGSAKTWEITVKVKCDVVVDALNERAKIVSNDCDYSVRLW
ncbi:UNVERIFIED_CONTAM: NDR1/HIN1-like protein 13 [Sesamum radiatum]|uniref:NDR1/HIN1-like protein 13 n=1 Tax=Sesamum radiatum TaxID=300843 RepID=A0AAW2WA57_SESRA